jgi:hypothetical protein
MVLANADADAGFKVRDRRGTVESGETRPYTLHRPSSLKEMGRPDFTVTAEIHLYTVFKGAGDVRTCLACNARDTTIKVTFSSGKVVHVPPRSLLRTR